MEFYLNFSIFAEYLCQFIHQKNFDKNHFSKMKNSKYKDTLEYFQNKLKLDMNYDKFYDLITSIFTKFDVEILAADSDFYKKPKIDLIFRFLHYLLKSDRFIITNKIQNQLVNVYLSQTQTSLLMDIYNKMLDIFKTETSQTFISSDLFHLINENIDSETETNSQSTNNSNIDERINSLQQNLLQISQQLQTITSLTLNNLMRNQNNSSNLNSTFNSSNTQSNQLQIQNSSQHMPNDNLNSNINVNQNNSDDSEFNIHRNNIKNLLRKRVLKKNHISSFETLAKAKKTPPKYFYKNLPSPFLHDDKHFVAEYNDLLKKFQDDAMSLCLKHLNREIKEIDESIEDFKTELRPIYSDIDKKINSLEFETNEILKDELIRRDLKLKEILKYDGPNEYNVKEKSNKNQNNSLFSYSDASNDSSSTKSKNKNKIVNRDKTYNNNIKRTRFNREVNNLKKQTSNNQHSKTSSNNNRHFNHNQTTSSIPNRVSRAHKNSNKTNDDNNMNEYAQSNSNNRYRKTQTTGSYQKRYNNQKNSRRNYRQSNSTRNQQ